MIQFKMLTEHNIENRIPSFPPKIPICRYVRKVFEFGFFYKIWILYIVRLWSSCEAKISLCWTLRIRDTDWRDPVNRQVPPTTYSILHSIKSFFFKFFRYKCGQSYTVKYSAQCKDAYNNFDSGLTFQHGGLVLTQLNYFILPYRRYTLN